jgi:outer membrane lipopolysaccharide assembly protein LptE/RlpB
MRPPRLVTIALLASALPLLVAGCEYRVAGSAAHLPKSVHTVAVPVFENATQSYHTELQFTEAVIHEFSSRTPYSIANSPDAADAVVRGTITKFDIIPLTYNSKTGQSSSFLITILARVTVADRDNRVLYKNDGYLFRQQYQTTQDLTSFIQEDPAAVRRLSKDFAQSLVSDILDSF